MNGNHTILVVGGNRDFSARICQRLKNSLSCKVLRASSSFQGYDVLARIGVDILLVDTKLIDSDYLRFCTVVKSEFPETSIILISNLTNLRNRVRKIYSAIDDYITKPFSMSEVETRVGVLISKKINQMTEEDYEYLKLNKITLNQGSRSLVYKGKTLFLTHNEYGFFKEMLKNGGCYENNSSGSVSSMVSRLRKKMQEKFGKSVIDTVYGVGYKVASTV